MEKRPVSCGLRGEWRVGKWRMGWFEVVRYTLQDWGIGRKDGVEMLILVGDYSVAGV